MGERLSPILSDGAVGTSFNGHIKSIDMGRNGHTLSCGPTGDVRTHAGAQANPFANVTN